MRSLLSVFGLILLGMVPAAATRYADGPPPGHTGGFGEPTCQQCHFDQPLNDAAGSLALEGLPDAYRPGERYRLTVTLARPGLGRGGFQLATRFEDGRPAGELHATRDGVSVEIIDSTGVSYVHHTKAGTALAETDTARWMVEWLAPKKASQDVVLHVAANAANDDASEFGDFIYTLAASSKRSDDE